MTTSKNDITGCAADPIDGLPYDPPWPPLVPVSFYNLVDECDRLRKKAQATKSAVAARRRLAASAKRRAALIDMVASADPDEYLLDVLLDLADAVTSDADFPIPGEWFDGIDWFRSGVLQIVGERPNPDDTIVFRHGASHPHCGAFRWSSSECFAWIWPEAPGA